MTDGDNLRRLLRPGSVAIVGLSSDPAKHGARVLTNLRRFGYTGQTWGVNPRAGELHGVATYPSLADLPARPDAIVLAVPADQVLPTVEQAAQLGVGGAVLFGGGFAETGTEGARLQRRVSIAARAGGVRLLGPNSAGIISAADGVVMSFLTCLERPAEQLRPGPVALVTQSGGTASYIHNLAAARGSGTAVTVSTGNEADIGVEEVIGHLLERSDVRAVAVLLETVRDGAAFLAAASRALESGKPLVVCRVGRSSTGERVMRTHTGALAGPARRLDAVLDAYGITVVGTPAELFDVAELMARSPLADGGAVGVVTHSGGTAVLLADKLEAVGAQLPQPSTGLQERLTPYLQLGAAGNPTDLGGIITQPGRYAEVVRLFLADPAYDTVVAASTPHPRDHTPQRAHELAELARSSGKPLLNLWLAGDIGAVGLRILREAGVAVTTDVDAATAAVAGLSRVAQVRRRAAVARVDPDPTVLDRLRQLQQPTEAVLLDEPRSKAVLELLGWPVPRRVVVRTPREAAAASARLGFPVVAKVVSAQVAHKSDVGGVRLDLRSEEAVEQACSEMATAVADGDVGARVEAYLVEEFTPGPEMILGATRDATFGPMVLVGTGGILTEVLDDVALSVAPLTTADAVRMVRSLAGHRLLSGARGAPPADEAALVDLVVRLSVLAATYADVIEEVDLNPVIFAQGVWRAADALVRLAPARATGATA